MATQGAPELPSSYKHIESTTTYVVISSEINPEMNLVTPILWANEKMPTYKWIEKTETGISYELYPGHSIKQLRGNSQLPDFP